jgi:hypothetical protein
MKGFLHTGLVLSFCLLAMAASAQKSKKLDTPLLSVQYPAAWAPDYNRLQVNGTVRLAPVHTEAGDLGTEVVIDFLPAHDQSLDDIINESADAMEKSSRAMTLGLATLEVDKVAAFKTTAQLDKIYAVFNKVVYKDKICRITCFTTDSDHAAREKDFEMILASIKLK